MGDSEVTVEIDVAPLNSFQDEVHQEKRGRPVETAVHGADNRYHLQGHVELIYEEPSVIIGMRVPHQNQQQRDLNELKRLHGYKDRTGSPVPDKGEHHPHASELAQKIESTEKHSGSAK